MFTLESKFSPKGDQVNAIKQLMNNFSNGDNKQVLLGATGTGKTFTIANIIKSLSKKTLVLAPNKTLAGQLYGELKSLFPNNNVEYFISYYDYYQPEAYVATKDLYIEKDASINDQIDELRHRATASLLTEEDVIVVASVSCIYGIGDIEDYKDSTLFLRQGGIFPLNELLNKLVHLQYIRNDYDFKRGTFRVRGDIVEIILARSQAEGVRIYYYGDEIEKISFFDTVTGQTIREVSFATIYPNTHFVTEENKLKIAIKKIEEELEHQVKYFNDNNMLLEAQRIEQRTKYDLEMLTELGYCTGVENYARHLSLKEEGETPTTLMDFFGDDFLMIIDESHVTIPQVRGMYFGDRSRKESLVNHGFRLPSALDNRPLKFDEFEKKLNKTIFLSATPGKYEVEKAYPVVQQIIRPTYLLDPEIEIRKTENQVLDLYYEIKKRAENGERTLVTTLTIKMSEDLTSYYLEQGLKVAYLHSEIKALERMELLRDLRLGKYDCLVGINLLREGLDLPEVSLVAILDADKQGFLRSTTSLIQTMGRAARNLDGRVIMYADVMTPSMSAAIDETTRRREIQRQYNIDHNVSPQTILKEIRDQIGIYKPVSEEIDLSNINNLNKAEVINNLNKKMKQYAKELSFEKAIELRDIINEIKKSK